MTKLELERYNDFLFKQILLSEKKEIKLIYRGDSLKNLCEKLNVDYLEQNTNVNSVLNRLFMVGEKAKRYYIDDGSFEIDNYQDVVFEKIIKYLNDSIKNKNKNTITFFERNIYLKEFFSNKYNKSQFIDFISNASIQEKLLIRNYYLILLHQLAAINYKNKSHFVSTSEDYRIAEKFSKSSSNIERVILHCWHPFKKELNIVRKYKLPTYTLGPYHYQKEYSLIGGILPHYIAGIEFTHLDKFYPNPNIFKQEISNELFYSGLDIDQSNFDEILSLTSYKSSIATNGFEIWENKKENKM